MYHDKTPIAWKKDSFSLILRKISRQIASTPIVISAIATLVRAFERFYPSPAVLGRLYLWLSGSYMYVGFREGLREIRAKNQTKWQKAGG